MALRLFLICFILRASQHARVASVIHHRLHQDFFSYDQALLQEAAFSVDALVADSSIDDYNGTRSSTPSVPPGFLPHPQPAVVHNEGQPKPISRFVPTSAPFTPSRSLSNIPRTATPLGSALTTETSPRTLFSPATSKSQAKQDVRKLATAAGLSKAIASQSSQPALQDEDFPALETGKGKASTAPAPSKVTSKATSTAPTRKSSVVTPASAQTPSKEKRSGVLNISVPSKVPIKPASDGPVNDQSAASNTPATPSTVSIQSPLSKTAATKTLRIASNIKPETPTAGSATPSSVTSAFPPFPPSRQPSLASISRHERPGTPTSEMISDNASITSTSMSRANSPPPSRIGSAPVRQVTKSMQKKQRKETQKEKDRLEAEAVAAATKEEPKIDEIAPILGRKKKQKKERTTAGRSTPAASRPASPSVVDEPAIPEERKAKAEQPQSQDKNSPVEPEVAKTTRNHDAKGKNKAKSQSATTINTTLEPAVPEVEEEPVSSEKHTPTAASTLQDLIASGDITDPTQLAIFKNPSAGTPRFIPDTEIQPQGQKLTITPEDRAALLAGKPVRKYGDGQIRIMLTPNGDYVRNLSAEEEERYLQLQAQLAAHAGAASFVSTKHTATNGFTLIGGRAVPNGPPSFFPTDGKLDPVSKIQRDEALSYINQYVLPSLSTNSQLEKALNANANVLDMPAWGTGTGTASNNNSSSSNSNNSDEQSFLDFGIGSGVAVEGSGSAASKVPSVSLLGLSEAEAAMQIARKETDAMEKKLVALWKKNRRTFGIAAGH